MKFLALALCLFTSNAFAVTVTVYGKAEAPLLQTEIAASVPTTVGDVSIAAFDREHTPYVGGNFGINKLFDLGSDLEVISNTEMKAYGWCFLVNGVIPETMADKTPITNQSDAIIWFYGFARYKDGAWVSQCER